MRVGITSHTCVVSQDDGCVHEYTRLVDSGLSGTSCPVVKVHVLCTEGNNKLIDECFSVRHYHGFFTAEALQGKTWQELLDLNAKVKGCFISMGHCLASATSTLDEEVLAEEMGADYRTLQQLTRLLLFKEPTAS